MPSIRILILILCLTTAVNAMVAWYLDRRYKIEGPLYWGVGTALISVGLGLIVLRGMIPVELSIVISNSLVLIGYGVVWFGMRRFVKRPFSTVTWGVAIGILTVGIVGQYILINEIGLRSQLTALGIFFLSLFIANTLFSSKHGRLCVTLTGMAYSLNALVSAMRSIMLVIAPFTKPFMNSGPAIQGFFIFSILFDLCVIFGQYYMVTNEAKSPINHDESIGDTYLS